MISPQDKILIKLQSYTDNSDKLFDYLLQAIKWIAFLMLISIGVLGFLMILVLYILIHILILPTILLSDYIENKLK